MIASKHYHRFIEKKEKVKQSNTNDTFYCLQTKKNKNFCILFYRMGDFVNVFRDTKQTSKELELTQQRKTVWTGKRQARLAKGLLFMPMNGVSHASTDGCLCLLVCVGSQVERCRNWQKGCQSCREVCLLVVLQGWLWYTVIENGKNNYHVYHFLSVNGECLTALHSTNDYNRRVTATEVWASEQKLLWTQAESFQKSDRRIICNLSRVYYDWGNISMCEGTWELQVSTLRFLVFRMICAGKRSCCPFHVYKVWKEAGTWWIAADGVNCTAARTEISNMKHKSTLSNIRSSSYFIEALSHCGFSSGNLGNWK